MEIADLLSPEAVVSHIKVGSKKQLLQELARHAAELTKLSERRIYDTLAEREKLGSTGMGQGIAIPHGRLQGIEKMTGLFARLDHPVDFGAADDQPVDLVFLLLAPEGAGADHLKALARVSRLLRNQSVCEKLRAASQTAALYALLTEPSSASSQAA
jgi:PTS system nitrogen regulatory IIA component